MTTNPSTTTDERTTATDLDGPALAASLDGPMLIALDVDETIVPEGTIDVPPVTADAVQDVTAAGHHVVLSTGRSLVGTLPVAASLGLASGWLVCSNGAVTARLTRNAPGGYELTDAFTLDVPPVVRLVRQFLPETQIAAEEIGYGYHVTRQFEPGLLNGRQTIVTHNHLPEATPRLVLHTPGVTTLLGHLRALDVTATPAGENWIDLAAGLISKATALYRVRRRLGVHPDRTLAIGDAANDLPMFRWATTAIAMGHAPAVVRMAADAVTGTLAQHGAASILDAIAAGKPIAQRVDRR
ncbi:HAD family hydrolase [Myceligenerans pegani]|uniref:HAD-IIB family hydrolase n=1 Tax=Myceligenerans pegani TaxID=2776917 RepID=A0ABR9N275_9MICO|nr:HAD-IIB family hydrolase [Myceligenerans sp. TRM 65318]MBE1877754.1 HAD-IIB family hydrolase [Myceligenerans sp. TRM 65318]MBE3020025.1 HAD-IIB family hydrolase [Myceligenerans sp. TRM 65318]